MDQCLTSDLESLVEFVTLHTAWFGKILSCISVQTWDLEC
jgi:hypothetical protein